MLTCLKCIDLAMFAINVLLKFIAKACLLYIIVLPIKSMSVIYKSVVLACFAIVFFASVRNKL